MGTPISNSITEMFTVQRYLQSNALKAMNMEHFDSWASRFGETTTTMELAPEGTGYRPRERFAKFFNLPELMNIFHEVLVSKTVHMLIHATDHKPINHYLQSLNLKSSQSKKLNALRKTAGMPLI